MGLVIHKLLDLGSLLSTNLGSLYLPLGMICLRGAGLRTK